MDAVDQAITEFAQHLIPEAFAVASTADRVQLCDYAPGPPGFAEWIAECRRAALAAGYPFGGAPSAVVFVRRGDTRWRWDADPCCELEWLTARLSDEISSVAQPWVYVASLREWPTAPEDRSGPARTSWAMPWYAEGRDPRVARIARGVVRLVGTEVVAERPLASGTGFERAARRVLYRHPSRKRHRLR